MRRQKRAFVPGRWEPVVEVCNQVGDHAALAVCPERKDGARLSEAASPPGRTCAYSVPPVLPEDVTKRASKRNLPRDRLCNCTVETGSNADRQRANTKEEDPTGLLNEGHRMRELETGVWLSRAPAGFVDGPNLYAYVRQNPWTAWDPHGLNLVKRLALRGIKVIRHGTQRKVLLEEA